MIFTLTLNPALDRYLYTGKLIADDTVRIDKIKDYPAGKGVDVSRVINELGGHSVAIAFLGGRIGDEIEEMLNDEGVVYASVRTEGETRMNILIESDGGQYRLSLPGPDLSEREIDKLHKTIDILLREGDTLLMCGSVPGGVGKDIYRVLCERMNGRKIKVYIDSDKEPLAEGVKASPTGIKPNTHELDRLLGRESGGDYEKALREVSERYSIPEVLLTMGKEGAMAMIEGRIYRVEVPAVPVKSAVGAGDSFLGAYCMYREMGGTVETALKMAGAASVATVMTPGTELCRREDVVKIMEKVKVNKKAQVRDWR